MNIEQIQSIIPHRPPFLLVDRVCELGEKHIVALKNVTMNEPHFMGHFPQKAIMPGVLICEALAQAGAIVLLKHPEHAGKLVYFAGIDGFRFRKAVVPGDVLRLEVELKQLKGFMGVALGKAYVGEELCADGTLKFAIARD